MSKKNGESVRGKYATVSEVARHFSVCTTHVYRWVATGALEAVRLPSGQGERRTIRVEWASVERFEEAARVG